VSVSAGSAHPPTLLVIVPNNLRVGGGQEQDILGLASRLARGPFRVRVLDFNAYFREQPRFSETEVTSRLGAATRTTLHALPGLRALTTVPTPGAGRRLRDEMLAADLVLSCPYYLEDAVIATLARLNHRTLVASQNNTFLHRVRGNPRETLQDLWNRLIGIRLLRSIGGVRAVSTDEQETLRKLRVSRTVVYYGFSSGGAVPVPPSAPPTAPSPTGGGAPTGVSAELRVLIAGRMTAQKGMRTVSEILRRLGEAPGGFGHFHFTFAGTRHLPNAVERFVREAPGHVENLGFVVEGLESVFQRSDVLLMPSLYESLGTTAIEAIRHGVPVVASDISGLREVVRPGETGWLASPDDPDGFLRLLEQCREVKLADPAEWNKLRSRCRSSFERRFGPAAMDAQYTRFLEWLRSTPQNRS